MIRTYSELCKLKTLEERFNYLKINGKVGKETFGFDRYLNQAFYTSSDYRSIRRQIILRDNGCDLGLNGYDIGGKIYIHHMNPITTEDIVKRSDLLLNPEYLICTSFDMHNAIHYGDISFLQSIDPIERKPGDTCPWK